MEMCPFPASCKIAFAVSCLSLEDSNVTPNYWTAISRALPSPSAECNGIVGAMFQKAVALQVVHRKVLGKLITVCGDSTYLTTLTHATHDSGCIGASLYASQVE